MTVVVIIVAVFDHVNDVENAMLTGLLYFLPSKNFTNAASGLENVDGSVEAPIMIEFHCRVN